MYRIPFKRTKPDSTAKTAPTCLLYESLVLIIAKGIPKKITNNNDLDENEVASAMVVARQSLSYGK